MVIIIVFNSHDEPPPERRRFVNASHGRRARGVNIYNNMCACESVYKSSIIGTLDMKIILHFRRE